MPLALASFPLVLYLPVFDKLLGKAVEAVCSPVPFDPSKLETKKLLDEAKNNFRSSGSTKIAVADDPADIRQTRKFRFTQM